MFDINKCYDCFYTEPNTAYFWSGLGCDGADIAAEVAQKNGGTTLEMLMEKNKDSLVAAGFDYDEDLGGFYFTPENSNDWKAVSKAYAEQASGEVHAVLGDNVREGSVWNTEEYPTLADSENKKVTKVISVDPVNGEDKTVLLDKNELEQTPIQQEADKADKIDNDNKNTEDNTMKNVANENDLPQTENAKNEGLSQENVNENAKENQNGIEQ